MLKVFRIYKLDIVCVRRLILFSLWTNVVEWARDVQARAKASMYEAFKFHA